jgi:hypothetical protein
MRVFTKPEKKVLRKLANEAYARELHQALGELDSAFSDWRDGHIDGFQLSAFVHGFQQGISRDLYSQYTGSDPGLLVARAVARRLLKEAEVPKSLLAALKELVEYCRDSADEPETE